MSLFFRFIGLIEQTILIFYPPFKKVIPEQTFKYAATGGINTFFDILLYFIFYNYILDKNNLTFAQIIISPHIAAFLLSFLITFPTGFILAKYISFPGSDLKKRIQLVRYGISVSFSILINYFFLKLFVEVCNWYPTPSKIITTFIAILCSYTTQKYFTFKQSRY